MKDMFSSRDKKHWFRKFVKNGKRGATLLLDQILEKIEYPEEAFESDQKMEAFIEGIKLSIDPQDILYIAQTFTEDEDHDDWFEELMNTDVHFDTDGHLVGDMTNLIELGFM